MAKIKNILLVILGILLMQSTVFAASAKAEKSAEKSSKGKELSNTVVLTLTQKEAEFLKDGITVTLDGAEWKGLSQSGKLSRGTTYDKLSANKIQLHIDPSQLKAEKNNYTVSIPVDFVITAYKDHIKAVINWGLPEYADKEVDLARCAYTHASLKGSIKERKKGESVYSNQELYYNKLSIYVSPDDAVRTRYGITITLDGAQWVDYKSKGEIKNDTKIKEEKKIVIDFKKTDESTLKLSANELSQLMRQEGYTITLPLTCMVTKNGDIKAIVDFGEDDIEPSVVTFARTTGGTVSMKAATPELPVDICGKASDIVVSDSTGQSFAKNKKIVFELSHSYRFKGTPTVEGSGRFADKCSVKVDKDNTKKCIVTFTQKIESGTDGAVTLKNIVIERPEKNPPNTNAIKMNITAEGSEKYTDSVQIAAYEPGAEIYQPALEVGVKNANASANDSYAFLSDIYFTDISSMGYKKGDRIEMSFDKDFVWYKDGKMPTVTAEGKFKDKCAFEYDGDGDKKAYVVFTEDVAPENGGKITVKNAVLQHDKSGEFDVVKMTAGLSGDTQDRFSVVQAAKFSSLLTQEPEQAENVQETETAVYTAEMAFLSIGDSEKISSLRSAL